jgi:hypothetical protein
MVTVAIAEQDDRLYVRVSFCDGSYSTRDGFTIALAFTVYWHRQAGDKSIKKQ